jgi:hypothetical protein
MKTITLEITYRMQIKAESFDEAVEKVEDSFPEASALEKLGVTITGINFDAEVSENEEA